LKTPERTAGLTAGQLKALCDCFVGFPAVEQVLLYGSRAKGNWHERSDIDLAVKGPQLDRFQLARLLLDIDDSDLPFQVDLLHYDTFNNARLKDHIDRVGIVIFDREQPGRGAAWN
jgi:predicted nucleotidyltransferase